MAARPRAPPRHRPIRGRGRRRCRKHSIPPPRPQWPPRRQPGVDRSLIRLAIYEMTSTDTPPRVVLDEAIELAKEFSTEQSPAFVNGVLDAVLKEHESLTRGSGKSQ